jgi:hypothetical protein
MSAFGVLRSGYETGDLDFKPTLAHERLTEKHGLNLSLESVRQFMTLSRDWPELNHE